MLAGLPHAELIAISFGESILAIHPPTLKFDLYHKGPYKRPRIAAR